jgi:ring-1,2-phenylacetyl-CoA epoxidase subunit PaaC
MSAETMSESAVATRDLILVLADSKRLLGTRYAEWILGAPELEAGIACASMAQDEWGHARLLYALLKDFGDDTDQIEHGREPADYRSMEVLDNEPRDWGELVVLNALVDGALTIQLEALRESSHVPLRQRVGKLIDEEIFHAQHGAAWMKRLATASDEARSLLNGAVRNALPHILRWFGADVGQGRVLLEDGVVNAMGGELRARYLERVAPLLALLEDPDMLRDIEPDFASFDDSSRRTAGSSPDAATIKRVRGDKNRQVLVD